MLLTNAITQAEGKFLFSQKTLTSIITEIILQMVCHEMTKTHDDIPVTFRVVQINSVTVAKVSSEIQ